MRTRILYLARHGAAQGGKGRYIGDTDLPLSDAGREQAFRLGRFMADLPLTAIYCSDLRRGRDTAAIVAQARPVPVTTRPDLREISMGAWEGLAHEDVAARFPEEYRARGEDLEHYRPPGGESFADCGRRARRAMAEILAETHGDLLIVGHAGLNRTLLCHWCDAPMAELFRFRQDTGAVNVIELAGTAARVALVNFCPET
jgi:alpha-ribazole phosphatase